MAQMTSFQSRIYVIIGNDNEFGVHELAQKLQTPNITRWAWPAYCFFDLTTAMR